MARQAEGNYEFGPFLLDAGQRILLREGSVVPLSGRAFETLLSLVRRSGSVVAKTELIREVWAEAEIEENNLAQSISSIRKALHRSSNDQPYIETIPGRGYRFAARVRAVQAWNGDSGAETGFRADPETHAWYVKGRFFWNRLTGKGFTTAISCFEQGLQRQPEWAMGYVGIADAYIRLGDFGLRAPLEAFGAAHAAISSALAIDNSLAEAHTSLALLLMYAQWNPEAAGYAFQRAIEMDPAYATAHHWYGWYLLTLGRFREAQFALLKARELDPFCTMIHLTLALHQRATGRLEQAAAQFRQALDMDEDSALAHTLLGIACAQMNSRDEAEQAFRRALRLDPETLLAHSARAHHLALWGRHTEALQIRKELVKRSASRFVCPYHFAVIDAALGRTAAALLSLKRALGQRSPCTLWLSSDPLVNPLRLGAGLDSILERVPFHSRG